MKKFLITLAFSLIIITNPVYANVAQIRSVIDTATSTASIHAKIAELRQQLLQLQNKLQKQELVTSTVTKFEFSPFVTTLTNGMASNEVTELQRYLSTQTKYYPAGIISGYYGPQTAEAVARYQKDQGLEPVGIFGPQTRKLINNDIRLSQVAGKENTTGRDVSSGSEPASEPSPETPLYPAGNSCVGKTKGDVCTFGTGSSGLCDNALNGHLLFCVPKR